MSPPGESGSIAGANRVISADRAPPSRPAANQPAEDVILARARVDTSPRIADEVKATTCYMCACRCGIKVHLQDGRIRYIEGNRDHPVNHGVLCAKGSAGIMQHYAPARLTKPLMRVGERGASEFREIEWHEALATATQWLSAIRHDDPRKLAFFTGRDQSQALTGWWASQFGTPNYAAHGGFCSVNMAAGGIYTVGGSFWEFGEPDWEHTRYFMLFGCAEDHDSNPLKIGLGKLKAKGVKFVSVNPVRTGYSAIADEWLGITPGTDGLFVLALVHELLRAGKVDLDYLTRYTNAPWLVIDDPGSADHGLFARHDDGVPLVWDRIAEAPRPANDAGAKLALKGEVTLTDGRRARPVFHLLAERYLADDYSPDAVAARTGIPAATIRKIAAELAQAAFADPLVLDQPWTDAFGRRHAQMVGRPVSMHAMRGISAHANGFHTCRALHLLQILLGSIDAPGGFRYKPPFPKPIPPAPKPAGRSDQVAAGQPLAGPPLGFPTGPEDLLVEADGTPRRIDKAFSWDAPLAAHGLMHLVITNAHNRDPYPIDTLFMYMANMAWNSAMNIGGTLEMLTAKDPATGDYRIPRIIYSDAYFSETVAYADLILPDTTYLERYDCISLLDRPICSADGPGGRDPPAGAGARPRRAPVPGRAPRARPPPRPAGHDQRRRQPQVSEGLRRLSRPSRAPARDRLAGRLARPGRHQGGQGRAQSRPAPALHRARLLLAGRDPARGPLLQARQPRLSRLRGPDGLHPQGRADPAPAVQRGPAEVPARGARPRPGPAARASPGARRRPISTRCRSGIRRSRTTPPRRTAFRSTRSASGRWRCTIPGAG